MSLAGVRPKAGTPVRLRRESMQSAASVGDGTESLMALCRHTADRRLGNATRYGGALSARSRWVMNDQRQSMPRGE